MTAFDYTTNTPTVHRLVGTPHVPGAKFAVAGLRKALRNLSAVLTNSGWTFDHPVSADKVALEVIETAGDLGPAERHALRIATAVLVKVAAKNGYHINN